MTPRKRSADALDALRDRYVGDDPAARAALQEERVHAHVAELIADYRRRAGLSQAQLARLVGTTQSVISRLEQADYGGHSLSMLDRVARALKHRVAVQFAPAESSPCRGAEPTMRFVFQELIRSLRRQRGLSVEQLAGKLGVEKGELLAAERDPTCRPTPLLIYKLSEYFELPQTRLAVLAGAVANVAPDVREEASRFAAKSESFAKLTRDEQQTLDEFVRFLKSGS